MRFLLALRIKINLKVPPIVLALGLGLLAQQTTGPLTVRSSTATTTPLTVLNTAASPTADLLDLKNTQGLIGGFNASGNLLIPTTPVVPPTGVSVTQTGSTGSTTYYYWVVAEFTIGNSTPSTSAVITTSANTLSASNYNTISWTAVPGANSYDVLRTTSATAPSGACNCAVAVAVVGTSQNDQSNTLNNYTVNSWSGNTTFTVSNVMAGSGESQLTFTADHGPQFTIDNRNGVSFPSLTSTHPAITSTSIEGTLYADQFPGSDLGAQFNAAETAANPGAVVVLPCGGDHSVSTEMVINKPIRVVGCGRSGRLIPTTALTGKPMFYMAEGTSSVTFTPWGDAVGMSLENVWIEDTSERGFQTDGIMMNWVKHAHLHDITVEALDGYALKLGDPSVSTFNPVSESSFDNLHFFWDGDSADQLPVLDIYTPAGSGDEHNDLYFSDSQITNSYYWAVRVGTGNSNPGPRHIWLSNIQVEGREALPSGTNQSGLSFPVTIPVLYDGVEIQHAQNIYLNGVQVQNSGLGQVDINITGTSANPVGTVSLINGIYGGGTCVNGITVNTSGTAVTWASGYKFTADGTWTGQTVTINGVNYTVANVSSPTSLTLTSSAGTQTGVAFSACGGSAYNVQTGYIQNLYMSGNQWAGAGTATVNYTQAKTIGNYYDFPPVANSLNAAGTMQGYGSNFGLVLQNNQGSGQGWSLNSLNDGSFSIFPISTSAALHLDNALTIGASGVASFTNTPTVGSTQLATVSQLPLSGTTGSIGGSPVAGGACILGTAGVTGATTAMAVVVSPAADPGVGFVWEGWVSSAGTVTMRLCNITSGSLTPNAANYNIRVIQ